MFFSPGIKRRFKALTNLWAESEISRILREERRRNPHTLLPHGQKVYSQCDEDGIFFEIFRRIGTTNRIAIEIGCGSGMENNTHALMVAGWQGVWIDADSKQINAAKNALDLDHKNSRLLHLEAAHVSPDNVLSIIRHGLESIGHQDEKKPDLLSIDIDGFDLEVTHAALTALQPRVICVEYNAKFPPPIEVSVPFSSQHTWAEDDYQGASLASWCKLLEPAGYSLVCCNISGVNAFFVRNDEVTPHFPTTDMQTLYQPPRYYLVYRFGGHSPSLKFLRDRIARDE